MEKEPTPPSTPPASIPLPSFLVQTLEDIHKKFSQLREYESSVCPFPASTFCHPVAFKRDRYYSIRPWAHNRVELVGLRNLEHPYINASRIDLGRKNEKFIATHGPLEDEFGRFWRMVWQEKSELIVMLTQPSEKGVEKCAVYYPEKLNEVLIVDEDLEISVQCLSLVEESRTLIRELKLVRGKEERRVWHLLFTAWPDNMIPTSDDQTTVMDLIKMSRFRIGREANGIEMMENGPRIVHCSAGVGRTGTFIALDYLLQEMENWQMKDMGDSDPILEAVKKLREQRTHMVLTEVQFEFLYQVLNDHWSLHYKSGGFSYFHFKKQGHALLGEA